MIPIDNPLDYPDGGGGGTGGGPLDPDYPAALAGLGAFLFPRYRCNVAVSEEVQVLDLLHEVIFVSSRMYMTQGANGKIRIHNHKPVDWALGTTSFDISDTVITVDDVSPWITDQKYFLLIDPHTNDSEVRVVLSAAYSTAQNSVTLTGDGIFTITGFSGADPDTPATAEIEVGAFTDGVEYDIVLDGYTITFIATVSDTEDTIAAFLAGAFRGHPALNRRFSFSVTTDTVTITGRFGTLTLDSALEKDHVAPLVDPTVAPTLTAEAGTFAAGVYRVSYTYANEHGESLLSPFKEITLLASEQIAVSTVTLPAGATSIRWYVVPAEDSTRLRFHSANNGAAFDITTLPLLTAPLPPDLNRTGTEVMRVKAVFSDREESRSSITGSNVLRASFEWLLGNRRKVVNRIDLKYRDATQDWRLIELRLRDDAHIAKTKKTSKLEVNGQAIDNYFQAYRIAAGELAVLRDADFFYKWKASREALLLEEGDVVVITDDGSGVVNLPVSIEEISLSMSKASMPRVSFTGMKYSTTLYDDSVVERAINVIHE